MADNPSNPTLKSRLVDGLRGSIEIAGVLLMAVAFVAIAFATFYSSIWCFYWLTSGWKLLGVIPWLCAFALIRKHFEFWILIVLGLILSALAPGAIDGVHEAIMTQRNNSGK